MASGRASHFDYSTLEVAAPEGESQSFQSGHGDSAPEAVVLTSDTTAGETNKSEFDGYTNHNGPGAHLYAAPTAGLHSKPRRYCGLSRRTTLIIVVVAILIIGGIVGGVVGGLESKNRNTGEAPVPIPTNPASNSSSPTAGPLANSRLTALNWTDSSSTPRRAVFYQQGGALLMSQYHVKNTSWTTFNISYIFAQETGTNALNVKTGSPLSAVAVPEDAANYSGANGRVVFVACLYFINVDNQLRELVSRDENLLTWTQGDLRSASLVATNGSSIAAVGNYCAQGCKNAFCLMYQGTDLNTKINCNNDWTNTTNLDAGYPGGGLAAIPFASGNGRNLTSVSEFRLFYYTNGVVDFFYYNYLGYIHESTPVINSQNIIQDKAPQLVATCADFRSVALVVSMDGAGTFTGSFYANTAWTHDKYIRFVNQGSVSTDKTPNVKLTSVAMNQDGSFYGIAANGSSIIEYAWNYTVPFDFTWARTLSING